METAAAFFEAHSNAFLANKRLADKAVAQLAFEQLKAPLDANTNSIAIIMKHVAGNLKSRWTDFLTSDGEKPWRNRDDEFVDQFHSREQLLECWEQGWHCLFRAIASLGPSDAARSVLIRGEPHSVPLALARSLGHTCYHVGQIVLLARHWAGDDWNTLTIPRGGSQAYNDANWGTTGRSHA